MTARAERVGTFEPGSEEWHAARAEGIGASEIAAVVHLSPWESHFGLWHRKQGLIGPQAGDELMVWGHYLEEPIARRFAAEHPELRVQRTGTWRSRMRPWQLANPDRLAYTRPYAKTPGTRIPVEVKWSPNGDGWGPAGSDQIPIYYRCQVQWQMDVLGAEQAIVAALVGSEYREYVVGYDHIDAELLRKSGQRFMDSLAAGEVPDIDSTGHTYRALKELHPDIDNRDAEIDPHLAGRYRGALRSLEDAADGAQQAKNEVLAAMGTARYAVVEDQRIARRQPGGRGSIALHEVKPPKEPQTIKESTA